MTQIYNLPRDKFREAVFKRDNGLCVICGNFAVDAHHILDRKLWPTGGYHLDNGASLCEKHHMEAETTDISVEEIRKAAKITKVLLPDQLFEEEIYDKWGNPILPNGMRLRGEMFHDENVQKVLADKLHLFTHWVKYPRTFHLPWSPGLTKDDKRMPSTDGFKGKQVILTTKMDGENTTMYTDHIHARSLDSSSNETRSWVKRFWSGIRMDIPNEWRICGENLYAEHSIPYKSLPSYFLGFSVWNEKNYCLPWDETKEWFELLGITPVPVLYRGFYDEDGIRAAWSKAHWTGMEGYVLRTVDGFHVKDFDKYVGKFVRKGHVQTDQHWSHGPIKKNGLAKVGDLYECSQGSPEDQEPS